MVWKQAHPYPVAAQVLFGGSFVAFLLFSEKLFSQGSHRVWLAVWCGVQIALGVWLVKARLRARKRILRCIRCEQALRSKPL
jgi:hypothetical protein